MYELLATRADLLLVACDKLLLPQANLRVSVVAVRRLLMGV